MASDSTLAHRASASEDDLFAARLQLVTGKGGVGKTSVAAALALAAARRGLRPLVVELTGRASLGDVLGTGPLSPYPTLAVRGVQTLSLQFDTLLSEYVAEHIPFAAIARRVAEHAGLKRFLMAAPGATEALTLDAMGRLVLGSRSQRPEFDRIFVDLDATGHSLMLLEVPHVIRELLGRGPLRRSLGRTSSVLEDGSLTRLHLVTVAETLAVQETLELWQRLKADYRVPLGALIINQYPADPIPHDMHCLLDSALDEAATLPPAVQADLLLARAHVFAYRQARRETERLSMKTGLPTFALPQLVTLRPTLDELAELGAQLLAGSSSRGATGS
jgi:anion-transporting  ArsA/GET3 family ATPase